MKEANGWTELEAKNRVHHLTLFNDDDDDDDDNVIVCDNLKIVNIFAHLWSDTFATIRQFLSGNKKVSEKKISFLSDFDPIYIFHQKRWFFFRS